MRVTKQSTEAVEQAVSVLKSGGVIAFPTETTYGLGCDPRNLVALSKIYRMKNRDQSKPLPLVSCSVEQVRKFFDVPPTAEQLISKYWPGPLTILLQPADMSLRRALPVYRDGLAAIRVSSHPFVQLLACAYAFPITATSANMSGDQECRTAEEVQNIFEKVDASLQPDLIIDGGELPVSLPSTIVKMSEEGKIEIVRQGVIQVSL